MRARPWVFGVSPDRDDIIWKKGINAKQINERSRPEARKKKAKPSDEASAKSAKKSAFGLSMENSESRWKADAAGEPRPDEDMVRDRKRVFRAYAGVKPSDDITISVGPELIIKDESHGESSANAADPDSAFGLGMKFKYDF